MHAKNPLAAVIAVWIATTLAIVSAAAEDAGVRQSAPPAPPSPSAPLPINHNDTGFVSIFNGQDLNGWDGDPVYWRVENGSLVGEVTPETLIKYNRFIIWRGGTPRDFELKAEYRISPKGNSGINYRSEELPDVKWVMRGYQADIDGANIHTGQNYEERGRTFLAKRGQFVHADDSGRREIATLGTSQDLAAQAIKPGDWNEYHLIVRGNLMVHLINDRVMSEVLDDDTANRKMEGKLGFQVHVGPPMKVEFRNIRLKPL